ncbi:MAG: adenylate kinase [Ignavibacteria bacterium]|nr:adenylate kinase [Ignavibacteria bacterium]
MIIILFGAPGVGKGTQASLLARKLGIAHLSTGDAFRTAIQNQTEVGKIAQSYVDEGSLVPDNIVASIVEEAMQGPAYRNGCILDGFPRNRGQVDALNSILVGRGLRVDKVINLEVDNETIIKRLLGRGRNDDSADVIEHRLNIYRHETEPLLEYYSQNGNLITVDGVGDIAEINRRILEAIDDHSD